MRTEKQIEASRLNGALSKGPVTPEGKARSARNSLRHGMFARYLILEGESREAFKRLIETLEQVFEPTDDYECSLLDKMALAQWRHIRLVGMEKAAMDTQAARQQDTPVDDPSARAFFAFQSLAEHNKTLNLMNRYEIRCDRQYETALRMLLRYRKSQKNKN